MLICIYCHVDMARSDAPLKDVAKQSESRDDFSQWIRGLDGGADDSDVHALRRDLVRRADHAHIDVVAAAHLRGRDDDLHGLGVVGTCGARVRCREKNI